MQIAMLSLISAIAAFLLCFGVTRLFTRDRMLFKNRLRALTVRAEAVRAAPEDKPRKSRIKVSYTFSEQLASAGIRMRPEEFLFLWMLAAFCPGGMLMLFDVHLITLIAVAALGLMIPPIVVKRGQAKRLVLFEKQLGDALLLMGNCLRSGLTLQQAMANIANEMPDPIAREFGRAIKEIRLGSGMDDALSHLVRRMRSADLMLVVSTIQIQREVGGNLLEILENIAVTIKERLKLKDDIRVMTATGRISGLVVGLIPVGIGGLLMLLNPSYIQTFFNTSLGIILLCAAGAMELFGFMIIKKIVTIKY